MTNYEKLKNYIDSHPGSTLGAAGRALNISLAGNYYNRFKKEKQNEKKLNVSKVKPRFVRRKKPVVIDVPYKEDSKAVVIVCNTDNLKSVLNNLV